MALREVEPGGHLVHFYADDDALAWSVADYAAEGLDAGEAAVLIAEPAHLGAIRHALRARGVDPDAGPARGIHLLDAAAIRARLMEGGRLVPERFGDAVGGVWQSASLGHAGVRGRPRLCASTPPAPTR